MSVEQVQSLALSKGGMHASQLRTKDALATAALRRDAPCIDNFLNVFCANWPQSW